MKFSAQLNRIVLLVMATTFAVLQTLSLLTLISQPFGVVLLDSFVHSLLTLLVAYPLMVVLRYGNLNTIVWQVRIIVVTALALLSISVIAGSLLGIQQLLFETDARNELARLLPLRAFISALGLSLCLLIMQKQASTDTGEYEDEPSETLSDKVADTVEQLPDVGLVQIDHIAVKNGPRIHIVPLDDIICLIADGDYVQVVTAHGKYLKEQTMKYFETHLPANNFVRVHRSCIVHTTAISRIELYEKSTQQLVLKNGDKIKVSQAGYKNLRTILKI